MSRQVSHRRITLEEMRDDHEHASALARLPGGVDVISDDGTLHFHLSIPDTSLDDEVDILGAQRDRALTSLATLVRRLERLDGYSSPQDQADLRVARAVLAEER